MSLFEDFTLSFALGKEMSQENTETGRQRNLFIPRYLCNIWGALFSFCTWSKIYIYFNIL